MNLTDLVLNYTPTDEAVDIVKKAKVVLLAGVAGAGKDTLKNELLKRTEFRDIVSHTTRPPRSNNGAMEQHGRDYFFIDIDDATRMINQKAFVEVKLIHGDTIYGTSVAEIKAGYDEGKISITDVDVQGIDEYKQLSKNVIAIFMLPPSYDVWRERLSKRYDTVEEFEKEWPKRRASALKELEHVLTVPYYHFIINDDMNRTIKVASEIAINGDIFNRKDDEARLAARDLLQHLEKQN